MFEASLLFNNVEGESPPGGGFKWHILKKFIVPLLVCVGMLSVAWGTWLYHSPLPSTDQINSVVLDLTANPSEEIIYIDISGAVVNPGIYPLSSGERVANAIDAAGGLSIEADEQFLHSTLNLSARLKDEQKIYIPFAGEQSSHSDIDVVGELIGDKGVADFTDSLISINGATANELDTLPRVGAVTAQKIIDGRPYTTIDDLVAKRIIGDALFAEIQPLIKL